jgi:hypothetical protein
VSTDEGATVFKKMKEAKAERAAQAEAARQTAETERLRLETHRAYEAWEAAKLDQSTPSVPGAMLKKDEVAYISVQGAGFVEPKHAPGQWAGRSSGFSFKVAKGVRYRVGASRGHFVQGEESPTVTDTGLFVVTSQRCLFVGSKRTTEWAYAKLLGFSLDGEAIAIFNVSNRQKATGVMYTTEVEHILDPLIAAAIAKFESDEAHEAVVAELGQAYTEAYRAWEASGGSPSSRQPEATASPRDRSRPPSVWRSS